jgi:glutathione S-transferase
LDEKYPQNPLHPKDPLQKSRDRIMVERFNGVISPYYKLCFSEKTAEPGVLTEFVTALDIFEEELRKRGTKFFGGTKPMMIDYMIFPWCERTEMLPFILGDKYELDKDRFGKLVSC